MNRMNVVAPVGLPPIGLSITINGQRFDCTGHEPYTRKDGQAAVLAVWQAECATCGAGFKSKTTEGRFAETRRCADHRAPGRRVTARGAR